jgi:proteic killer suppression protein
MIRSIKHRGLKRLAGRDDKSGLNAEQLRRIMDVLASLNIAGKPSDLDLPGYRLHALSGDYKGFWSVRISGNFRIVFRMEDGDVYDVDLVDYH